MKMYGGFLILLISTSTLFGIKITKEIVAPHLNATFSAILFQDNNTIALTGQKDATKSIRLYNIKTGELIKAGLLTYQNPEYALHSPEKNIKKIDIPIEIKKKDKKIIIYGISHSPFFGKKLRHKIKTLSLPTANVNFDASLSPDKATIALFYQNLENKNLTIVILQ